MKLVGREAQCPICGLIFGSDSTCELHKPYRRPVTNTCKGPVSVGLELRIRRGDVEVWVVPMPSDVVGRRDTAS